MRAELAAALQAMPNPVRGGPLIHQLYYKEQLYHGPYLETAPDLIFFMDDFRCEVTTSLGRPDPFELNPINSGSHRPDGLFIAWGRGVRRGVTLDANIVDIMPTVLHCLGLPVPDDVDGRILLEAFAPDSEVAKRPVVIGEGGEVERTRYEWSEEEREKVRVRLRGLGYLS
jgi:predicted AlkP superfamily phosphohydrolase/phosphomutase